MEKKRCTAVVLAAGSGKRMQSRVAKQFMLLGDKPLIYYALKTVEESTVIDDCVLVTGKDEIEYVQKEIVAAYGFSKVDCVIPGGSERCFSVAEAMKIIAEDKLRIPNRDGYVFIHDGARPFLTEEILKQTYEDVQKYHACVCATPSKDTVKIVDEQGFAVETPERKRVWNVQTPQVFDTELIVSSYLRLLEEQERLQAKGILVTDDASVVELFGDCKVKMTEGSYENIKITTPEDLIMAEAFMRKGLK